MTPAVRYLEAHGVSFRLMRFDHGPACLNYGIEAAQKLGTSANQVFKTLLLSDLDRMRVLVLVPVDTQANLRAIAQCLKVNRHKH